MRTWYRRGMQVQRQCSVVMATIAKEQPLDVTVGSQWSWDLAQPSRQFVQVCPSSCGSSGSHLDCGVAPGEATSVEQGPSCHLPAQPTVPKAQLAEPLPRSKSGLVPAAQWRAPGKEALMTGRGDMEKEGASRK